jgi:hypothetical protein
MTRRPARLPILAALALLAGAASAQTTWHVDLTGTPPGAGTAGDPYTSIQYAITQASTVSGDTLLVQPGIYTETVDYLGKALTVVSASGNAVTFIDGSGPFVIDDSVVYFRTGEGLTSVLDGFTVLGGLGTLDPSFTFTEGGGIFIDGASPTIKNVVVCNNDADKGGGIFGRNTGAEIRDSTVIGNTSSFAIGRGGGVHFENSAPLMIDVDVQANSAGASAGGGWFSGSSPVLRGCSFDLNHTTNDGAGLYFTNCPFALVDGSTVSFNTSSDGNGGGVYCVFSTVLMVGCTVDGNRVENDHTGGGIYHLFGSFTFSGGDLVNNVSARGGGAACFDALTLTDSRICSNTAQSFQALDGRGGGVYRGGGLVTARRCTFDGNRAIEGPGGGGEGGAIWGQAALENCTVVFNTATSNGGGVCHAAMKNTIHWFNTPTAPCSVAPTVTYSNVEGGYPGLGNLSSDPKLCDPANGDYHLILGSPCIDAGDPTSPSDPDGSRNDMGALPFDPNWCPAPVSYCTAGTSANGCQATLSSAGTPSASAASGFIVSASGVEGNKDGLFYFGTSGKQAIAWGSSSSYRCVVPPTKRGGLLLGTGTGGACDGSFAYDLNARWTAQPNSNPGAGNKVWLQLWYRDPQNTSNRTTSFSDALEFGVCP